MWISSIKRENEIKRARGHALELKSMFVFFGWEGFLALAPRSLSLSPLPAPSLEIHDFVFEHPWGRKDGGKAGFRVWPWEDISVSRSLSFPLYRVKVIVLVPCPSQAIIRIKCNRNYERHLNTLCNDNSRFAVKRRTNSSPINDCRWNLHKWTSALSGPQEDIWPSPSLPCHALGLWCTH